MNALLILALIALVFFGFSRWLAGMGATRRGWVLRWLILAAIVVFIGFVAIRGGAALAWPFLLLLAPFILRWQRLLSPPVSSNWQNKGVGSGASSTVETRWFRMSLDHDTGTMDGEVLTGRYAGRVLGELAQAQLYDLWKECRADAQSVAVLEAFLDRSYPDWRTWDERVSNADDISLGMSREDAYAILGLQPGATVEEIKKAHKRLMQRVHPDQGGSTYLATRVNQAKDVLLRASKS